MEQVRTQLQQLRPELPINIVALPEGHSMNDMWLKLWCGWYRGTVKEHL